MEVNKTTGTTGAMTSQIGEMSGQWMRPMPMLWEKGKDGERIKREKENTAMNITQFIFVNHKLSYFCLCGIFGGGGQLMAPSRGGEVRLKALAF